MNRPLRFLKQATVLFLCGGALCLLVVVGRIINVRETIICLEKIEIAEPLCIGKAGRPLVFNEPEEENYFFSTLDIPPIAFGERRAQLTSFISRDASLEVGVGPNGVSRRLGSFLVVDRRQNEGIGQNAIYIQLANDGGGFSGIDKLIKNEGRWIMGGLFPQSNIAYMEIGSLVGLHQTQLPMDRLVSAAHGSELVIENASLNYGSPERRYTSKSYDYSRSIYATGIGVFFLFVGTLLLGSSIKLLDINVGRRRKVAAALLALFGSLMMIHGEFLAFFGRWGAP